MLAAGLRAAARVAERARCFGGLDATQQLRALRARLCLRDSGDGPAVFAIFILGFLILGGALVLEFRVGPPMWVHAVTWLIATPALAFVLLRVLKAMLIAQQYKHRAERGPPERRRRLRCCTD